MQAKRIGFLAAVFLLILAFAQPVSALSLKFTVERSQADVFINPDGTVSVEYLYVFNNDSGGDLIDFVDVGVPTTDYDLNSVKAEVDGKPITDIQESPYVKPGIALGLGGNAIQPGAKGTVRVQIATVRKMLFKTNKVQDVKEPYASFQFSPNSFGSEYVSGSTDMTVVLHLPAGLTTEEPRYFTPKGWPGDDAPTSGIDSTGSVYYSWQAANANSHSQYIFGSAFPSRLVPPDALVTEAPVNIQFNPDNLCPAVICIGMLGFFGLTIWGSIVGDKKRRLQYMPPKIALEGNGIKRGLTAIEAAILMEQPMDKVLSMMLFSTIKKGAVTVTSREPLKITRTPATVELASYETDFVNAMIEEKVADKRNKLKELMVSLVKGVTEKMRGFSRKESIAYYQTIMERAWEQVQAAETPEVKMQRFDEAMDWTMLDRRFDDRSRDVFGRGPVFLPMWWGRYDPSYSRGSFGGSQPSVGPTQVGQAPASMSLPSLPGADFAASMAGGIQSFSSNVVGDITNFTSGVTNVTNPVPKPTSSGYRGGGGGGGGHCACACACAGCACACAGGGR